MCASVQGSLQFVRTITGPRRYSRFGYAMVNLGDISGDGLDGMCTGMTGRRDKFNIFT